MINKTRDLFNTASKKVADFFTSKSDRDIDAMDPNPGGTYEDGVFKKAPRNIGQKVLGAVKGATKDLSSYGNRIKVYKHDTKPVIKFYKEMKKLVTINGMLSISDVSEEILKFLR